MKQIIKYLEAYVHENKIQREYALDSFLDFLLDFFSVEHIKSGRWIEHVNKVAAEQPALMAATLVWMNNTSNEIEAGGWYDSLGHLYEELYQSKGKASAMGQFFTPDALCDCMARITYKEESSVDEIISDSACGSGRTLLAAFSRNRIGYYSGEDLDPMSVKMCTLNLMIHGARGRVVCHNTLSDPIHFDWGYEINEVRYPFPTMYYSVRRISNPKPVEEKEQNSPKKDKQLSLF